MKKNLIIFGTGKISDVTSYYFERDSEYTISAFIVDDAFLTSETFNGKPVVALSKVQEKFNPKDYTVFVSVGYQVMNQLRVSKCDHFKKLGFSFAKYRSPYVKGEFTIGDNSIVMDETTVQPRATIGSNVFVWGGSMIGHHAIIDDNCWLTSGCLIGGATSIGQSSFVGLGAMVGHGVAIGERCMLGAGTLATKDLPAGTVTIAPNTPTHRLNSDQFIRMSTCFRV